ncbi:hypothetical protein DFJ74DRAFT_313668 [Hyaloraphidium curvatum]|nr:hypothetical protein DFJ74DRAFT_313668 [Hyaloraphidium curvatum]
MTWSVGYVGVQCRPWGPLRLPPALPNTPSRPALSGRQLLPARRKRSETCRRPRGRTSRVGIAAGLAPARRGGDKGTDRPSRAPAASTARKMLPRRKATRARIRQRAMAVTCCAAWGSRASAWPRGNWPFVSPERPEEDAEASEDVEEAEGAEAAVEVLEDDEDDEEDGDFEAGEDDEDDDGEGEDGARTARTTGKMVARRVAMMRRAARRTRSKRRGSCADPDGRSCLVYICS